MMLGYQTQSQGSTAGLTMYQARDYSYVLSPHHRDDMLSRNIQRKHDSQARNLKDLPSWALSLQQYAADRTINHLASKAAMATSMAEPADLSRLVDIEFAAFQDEKVNHHLSYRDGSDTSHLKRALRAYRKYMNNLRVLPEDLAKSIKITLPARYRADASDDLSLGFRFRKVESPEGGEIIAFCKSEMAALTPEDFQTPLDAGHEGEPQMNRDWFALNERCHREYCGTRKHCYFGMLATHPEHQHQGAATMLMNELVAEADRLGVEIYCEATRAGRPLYEKYGFVVVKEIKFATAPYGLDLGEETQFVMVRGALGPDGERCRVRTYEEALAESAAQLL